MPRAFVPHRYGCVMVLGCMLVFKGGWLIYNFIFIRSMLPAAGLSALRPIYIVIFNVVWFLAVWSYFRTRCTAAGGNTSQWLDFVHDRKLPVASSLPEWQPGQATYCMKCDEVRPERSHHCAASGTCVRRMDHYCPWTAVCVGFLNHKFFLLLATYNFLAVLVFLVAVFPVSLKIAIDSHDGKAGMPSLVEQGVVCAACVVAAGCTYFLGAMVQDHLSKGCKNVTSIEDCYENMPNPFDLGDWYPNLAQVMGAFGPDWFLPVMPWKPLSDGMSFDRSGDIIEQRILPLSEDDQHELWYRRYLDDAAPKSFVVVSESEANSDDSSSEDSAGEVAKARCFG